MLENSYYSATRASVSKTYIQGSYFLYVEACIYGSPFVTCFLSNSLSLHSIYTMGRYLCGSNIYLSKNHFHIHGSQIAQPSLKHAIFPEVVTVLYGSQ